MCVYFFLLQYFLSTSMLALICVCALDCMYTSECVCVCAPSLPGTAPGVLVVGTHCDNLLLSYAGDQHWWRGRVNSSSVAKLWSFNAPARIPATTPPPHRDTNTEWHNLMKFCSLKQVVVCRDGREVWEALWSFSSSVSLNSFHESIDAPVFSWPFSAVTRHWGMQIHVRNWPDTFPVGPRHLKTPQLSNKRGEGLISQKADRERDGEGDLFHQSFLPPSWQDEDVKGHLVKFISFYTEKHQSQKKGLSSDC